MKLHPPIAGEVRERHHWKPSPPVPDLNSTLSSRILVALFPREDPSDVQRVERTLSIARLCVSSCALALTFLDPNDPATLLRALLSVYTVYSLIVLLALEWKPNLGQHCFRQLTLVDIVCLVFLSTIAGGSQGALYMLSLLILYGTAYGKGLRDAAVTGVLMGALILLGNVAHVWLVHQNSAAWDWTFLRSSLVPFAYILVACLLVGFGAQAGKELLAERVAIAKVLGGLKQNEGLRPTLNRVCSELLRIFGARRILVAAHEKPNGIVHLLEAEPYHNGESVIRIEELDEDQCGIYLFPEPGRTWAIESPPPEDGKAPCARVLDIENLRIRRLPVQLPAGLLMVHPCKSLVAYSFEPGPDWGIRVFVMDPKLSISSRAGLFFMFNLFSQVWPALFEVYLARKSGQKAAQLERASLARELHDGVIQTLVTIDMKLESLRNRYGCNVDGLSARIGKIQEDLRGEVRGQRNLMRRLRSPNLEPAECVEAIRNVAAQFQEETGISTRFESLVDEVALPPRVCGEMLRIVQEALINVRKHSAAQSVEILLNEGERGYELEITDNGMGFDFLGLLTFRDLEAQGRGPEILKERVRLLAGELTIESTPGQGARLEILIPRESNDFQTA